MAAYGALAHRMFQTRANDSTDMFDCSRPPHAFVNIPLAKGKGRGTSAASRGRATTPRTTSSVTLSAARTGLADPCRESWSVVAIPEQLDAPSLSDYLAVLSRAVFQAGMSWAMIEARWPAYERLFEGFDPVAVARFDSLDLDRIASDTGIVRTRKKIDATVANARTMLELDREFGGFANYLHSFDSYDALSADIKRRFKFVGELSAYYFLFRTKEPVPPFEAWEKTVPGDHPRMREMVALARGEIGQKL